MKKTLAIVLALVMVLCMIPAMSAETTTVKEISGKEYTLGVKANSGDAASAVKANSITFNYDYEAVTAEQVDKWADDAKMATVFVNGFADDLKNATDVTITIDGKKLDVAANWDSANANMKFPVELTKAGYSDTYLIQVTGTKGDVKVTETAKISVKFVNTAAYKTVKTAYITNIAAADNSVDAYIVGDKIYLDYVGTKANVDIKLTFADEKKAAFSVITYAQGNTQFTLPGGEVKLKDSAATFTVASAEIPATEVVFGLETKEALYETKKYGVVVRENIKEADPKGIYFAESTKTIAMGESYTPVVMGVATGKKVAATIKAGDKTDKQIIDVTDGATVIGTREGVAYITAEYTTNAGKNYKSSSMKIVVTAGASIPPADTTTTYYVTCRNLNVRKGAGTSYAKTGMVHRGDALQVVEVKNGWAKLADGTYVCAKYIAK